MVFDVILPILYEPTVPTVPMELSIEASVALFDVQDRTVESPLVTLLGLAEIVQDGVVAGGGVGESITFILILHNPAE